MKKALRGKKKYQKPKVVKVPLDVKNLIKTCMVCPCLSIWDGKEYVKENSILPESENLLRKEKVLTDYYVLQNEPGVKNGNFSLKIKEMANDISWFNNFSLLTVEHRADYNIGFSPQGELLSYKKPQIPLSCRDGLGRDLLSWVLNRDWQNPVGFYEGEKGDVLELDFGEVAGKDLKLVIVDPQDGYAQGLLGDEPGPPLYKTSIHIYIFVNPIWQHIAVLHTRAEFYPDIIDLTPYLSQIKSNLKIKLEFTAQHKVAFVGIDTTPPIQMERKVYSLIQAIHTEFGDVTDILNRDNDKSVRLYPGETIELKFPVPAPAKPGNKLSYVLFSKGYYIPTTKMLSLAKEGAVAAE